MSRKVKIKLSNREAADRRVGLALGYLTTEKPLGYAAALQCSDVQRAIEKQVKRFEDAKLLLFKSHGAKRSGNGYKFDEENIGDPSKNAGKKIAPPEFYDELEKLEGETVTHELELIELPSGKDDKYRPVIFSMLGDFIARDGRSEELEPV